jgi:circadian clock protein KaiB
MQKKQEQESNAKSSIQNVAEYVLCLFVTGATPNSMRAITNIKEICEVHLKGNYSLEIIDVYQQADIAKREQLVALPMLLRKQPLPEKRLIGDLSDTTKVLNALGLIK